VVPRATARISIRFEIPALSAPRTTSFPESVTAVLNFRRMRSGSSRMNTAPCSVLAVVDMRFVGD
jgi:hypothetical protein